MTFEELARRAAKGAPELTDEQNQRLAELLRPDPGATARRRYHEVTRRRRWSAELDARCGVEQPEADPALDRYADGRLGWPERQALGRSA